ncbi:MAG: SAM-dependent chlorinase/fluorinase [Planctomycetaceae bacterium]
MPSPIITLTTDFGTTDSYVAQMKGTILTINPSATLVDITHAIPPQDVARAAMVLDEIVDAFPAGTIHLAVVDPGVGTSRAILAAELGSQRFVAPDNGLLTILVRRLPRGRTVRLTAERFWRRPVSATFHGRDIMAPVAAHWSTGVDIAELGDAYDGGLTEFSVDQPATSARVVIGKVAWIDSFGNLVTNIDASLLPMESRRETLVELGRHQIRGIDRCYADRPDGILIAIVGSSGRLEIAISGGSAASHTKLASGERVRVVLPEGFSHG